MYQRYIKRLLDFILSLIGLIVLLPVFMVLVILIKIKLGSPVIFKQKRPGKGEKIFTLYKFRSMTDEKDLDGKLLPDEVRLTSFGRKLRSTSLDELPELFNILKGDMSIVGPRPQLVRDMVFMSSQVRKRHSVRPGLTGLAQVSGRNAISWEDKFKYDLKYIKNISFINDCSIIIKTFLSVIKHEGIGSNGTDTSLDYGDYLLKYNKISKNVYNTKQEEALKLLRIFNDNALVSIIMPSYNTGKYIKESIESVINQSYENWELIIVDDCSKDNTDSIVGEFKDKRIKYYGNKKNMGAAYSRNRALKLAKGSFIAFLDSDDLWSSDKLEKQINFMKKNKCAFSYTNYEIIDDKSNNIGLVITGPRRITKLGMYNYCWPGCLTVMYNRNVIGNIQIENLKKNNDYAMWLEVIEHANCYLLDECLASYRKREGSISNNSKLKLIKHHYLLYKEGKHKNVFSSVMLTINNLFFGVIKKIIYVGRI